MKTILSMVVLLAAVLSFSVCRPFLIALSKKKSCTAYFMTVKEPATRPLKKILNGYWPITILHSLASQKNLQLCMCDN